MEINNLHSKEFKVMVTKELNEHGRRIDVHSENFNRELENIKKNKTELKNIVTEILKIHLEESTVD